jgi:hypothetical protein
MRKPKSDNSEAMLWRFPVAREDVAETGQHVDLVADAAVRAAVARMAGLRDVLRLEASFDVTRHAADGLRVVGRVSATVGQTCVVTLEPLTNEVEENIDLVFAPPRSAAPKSDAPETPRQLQNVWPIEARSEPEPLIGGGVDLGALATEFLFLGLDAYPRKPGAVFQQPRDNRSEEGPFAVLAQLTKDRDAS